MPGIWSLAALGGDQAVLVTPKSPLRPWSGTRTGLPVPAQVVLAWQSLPPPLPVFLSQPHLCSRPHPSIPLSLTLSLPLPCPFTPSFSLSLLCPFLPLTLGPAPCPCLALARLSLPSLLPCPSADPTTFPRTARVQIWDFLLQTEPAQGAGRGPAPDQRQLCTGQGTARSRLSCPTAGLLQPAPHTSFIFCHLFPPQAVFAFRSPPVPPSPPSPRSRTARAHTDVSKTRTVLFIYFAPGRAPAGPRLPPGPAQAGRGSTPKALTEVQ